MIKQYPTECNCPEKFRVLREINVSTKTKKCFVYMIKCKLCKKQFNFRMTDEEIAECKKKYPITQ